MALNISKIMPQPNSSCWACITFLLAIVHPVTSHPIQAMDWARKPQFEALELQKTWGFSGEKHADASDIEQAGSSSVSPFYFLFSFNSATNQH